MSFITNNKKLVFTGEEAANSLRSVIQGFQSFNQEQEGIPAQILEALIEDAAGDVMKLRLLEILKNYLNNDALMDLLTTIGDIETRDEDERREFGWPDKNWSKTFDDNLPFTLSLNAKAEALYQVLKHGETRKNRPLLPALDQEKAAADIRLVGSVGSKADGESTFSAGSIEANAAFSIERELEYHLSYTTMSLPLGIAVAAGLGRIRPLHRYSEVQSSFVQGLDGKLDAISYQGRGSLSGGGKVAIALPIAQAGGTLRLSLGGSINFGKGFSFVITPAADGNRLRIEGNFDTTRKNNFDVGASYKVGISSLSSDAVKHLLYRTTSAYNVITYLDKKLEGGEKGLSWLKPGTLLKGEITDLLKDYLNQAKVPGTEGADSRKVFAALSHIFGSAPDLDESNDVLIEKLSEATAGLIAEIVDDSMDFFGFQANIRAIISQALGDRMSEDLKVRFNDNVIDKALPKINIKLDSLVNGIDSEFAEALQNYLNKPVDDVIEQIRDVLDESRTFLNTVIEGIKNSVDEFIGIEMGYARETLKQGDYDFALELGPQHSDAFRSLILTPDIIGEWIMNPDSTPEGLLVDSFARKTILQKSNQLSLGMVVAGINISQETKSVARTEVIRTTDGVSLLAKSEIKKTVTTGDEERSMTVVSVHSIAAFKNDGTNEADVKIGSGVGQTSDQIVGGTPKLSLSLSEKDGNLKVREVNAMLRGFADRGIIRKEVITVIQASVREVRDENERMNATISLSLAVPPSQIQSVIEYGAGNQARCEKIFESSLRGNDFESIISTAYESGVDITAYTSRTFGGTGFESSKELTNEMIAKSILENIDELIDEAESKPGFERGGAGFAGLFKLKRSKKAIPEAFQIAAPIYRSGHSFSGEELNGLQMKMNSKFKPVINPKGWFGKTPPLTVAFFQSLQKVSHEAIQMAPPVIVNFQPAGGESQVFINSANY